FTELFIITNNYSAILGEGRTTESPKPRCTLLVSDLPLGVKPWELSLLFRPFRGYEGSLIKLTSKRPASVVSSDSRSEAEATKQALNGIHFDPQVPQTLLKANPSVAKNKVTGPPNRTSLPKIDRTQFATGDPCEPTVPVPHPSSPRTLCTRWSSRLPYPLPLSAPPIHCSPRAPGSRLEVPTVLLSTGFPVREGDGHLSCGCRCNLRGRCSQAVLQNWSVLARSNFVSSFDPFESLPQPLSHFRVS
ncbi:RNA-binding protein with multiple splicing-like, partial [Panthera pardus]|uniref:RNA-binding protein with multiple splicing-like n=1 Tax=Panthera pardus TaxID=9691 RepID=A0A9W2VD81_PANPR